MATAVEKTAQPASRQLSVIAAVTLLIASGAAYRAASAYLSPGAKAAVLPVGTLSRIPIRLGGWVGQDTVLSDELIEATDTDDHVSRLYIAPDGREQVSLFVGYGVRLRDLAPHRPEVCYSGSGWTLVETVPVTWQREGGEIFECRMHRFRRGGLGTMRMVVLNYYIVDGRYCPDVSLLRSKAWRKTASDYVAQVQIACSSGSLSDECEQTVKAFARESAEAIRACLVEGVARARAAETSAQRSGPGT